MAIEMVGRDIQDDGDGRMKFFDRLKLEAGYLEHIPILCRRSIHELDHRRPDISPHENLLPRMCQNLSRKGCSRGFPVRAADSDDLALQVTRGQLHLADDFDSELASLGKAGRVDRNAGTDNDQVLIAEGALAVETGLDGDSFIK